MNVKNILPIFYTCLITATANNAYGALNFGEEGNQAPTGVTITYKDGNTPIPGLENVPFTSGFFGMSMRVDSPDGITQDYNASGSQIVPGGSSNVYEVSSLILTRLNENDPPITINNLNVWIENLLWDGQPAAEPITLIGGLGGIGTSTPGQSYLPTSFSTTETSIHLGFEENITIGGTTDPKLININFIFSISEIPEPTTYLLMGSSLIITGLLSKKTKAKLT